MTAPALLAAALTGLAALAWTPDGRVLERLRVAPPARVPRARRRVLGERRRAQAEQERVAEFAATLAVEVRAGRSPRAAIGAASEGMEGAWVDGVRAAAASGADVAEALRQESAVPGAIDLRDLAACWQVADRTGAGLAAGLDAVAVAARERSAHRARVRAELAGVRATGWLLAGLPVLGAALGGAAGAQPWRVLLTTPAGALLLVLGLGLDLTGLAWLHAMTRRVEAST